MKKVYSDNTVIDYKSQKEWKIQLRIIINFTSCKDADEVPSMHTKSNNLKIIMGNQTDKF